MGPFKSKSKSTSVVGLDIEAGSIAATEVISNGGVKVVGGGIAELAPGIFHEGEVAEPEELGAAIKGLFSEHKLSKNVRLGVANQRIAVRSLRLPVIENRSERETAIRFQAQDSIPMPLDQAVLDWQVVGNVQDGGADSEMMEIVAVAARRDMLAQMTKALLVAGVRPIGIDHSAFAMIRALSGAKGAPIGAGLYVDAPQQNEDNGPGAGLADAPVAQGHPAKLICNLGDITNLAVARGTSCLFTRIAAFGMDGIAQKLAERRQLSLQHARQWVLHTGLEEPVETIEGDPEHIAAARECLEEGAARLSDELRLSLDYYAAQDGALAVSEVVICGPGSVVPGLVDRLQRTLGYGFTVAKPDALGHLDDATAARQTISFGLALEE